MLCSGTVPWSGLESLSQGVKASSGTPGFPHSGYSSFSLSCAAENCSGYFTCAHCLDQPGCGWCTDPSNTGKGKCIEGSSKGPMKMPTPPALPTGKSYQEPILDVSMCLAENHYNWSFIHCPGNVVTNAMSIDAGDPLKFSCTELRAIEKWQEGRGSPTCFTLTCS